MRKHTFKLYCISNIRINENYIVLHDATRSIAFIVGTKDGKVLCSDSRQKQRERLNAIQADGDFPLVRGGNMAGMQRVGIFQINFNPNHPRVSQANDNVMLQLIKKNAFPLLGEINIIPHESSTPNKISNFDQGVMHALGQDVEQDYKTAIDFFTKVVSATDSNFDLAASPSLVRVLFDLSLLSNIKELYDHIISKATIFDLLKLVITHSDSLQEEIVRFTAKFYSLLHIQEQTELLETCSHAGVPFLLAATETLGESDIICLLEPIQTFKQLHNDAFLCLVEKGYIDAVILSLDKGADPKHKNKLGQTAFHLATKKEHTHVLDLLLEKTNTFDYCDEDNEGITLLESSFSLSASLDESSAYNLLFRKLYRQKSQEDWGISNSLSTTPLLSQSMPINAHSSTVRSASSSKEMKALLSLKYFQRERNRQISCLNEKLRSLENKNISVQADVLDPSKLQEKFKQLERKVEYLNRLTYPLQLNSERKQFLESKGNESLSCFYDFLYQALEGYFISARLLNAGYIKRANYTWGDRATALLETGALFMPVFGKCLEYLVNGAGEYFNRNLKVIYDIEYIDIIKHTLEYAGETIHAAFFIDELAEIDEKIEHKVSHQSHLASLFFFESSRLKETEHLGLSTDELSEAAKVLAYEITFRYQHQIKQLKNKTEIHTIATCAQERLLELLRSGKIRCRKEHAVSQLLANFGNDFANEYSITLCDTNNDVFTLDGKKWQCHYVYSKPAIYIEEMKYQDTLLPSYCFAPLWSDITNYGKREGTLEEIYYLYKNNLLIDQANLPKAYLNIFSDMDKNNQPNCIVNHKTMLPQHQREFFIENISANRSEIEMLKVENLQLRSEMDTLKRNFAMLISLFSGNESTIMPEKSLGMSNIDSRYLLWQKKSHSLQAPINNVTLENHRNEDLVS